MLQSVRKKEVKVPRAIFKMDLVQRLKKNLYETFDMDLVHAIRLVVIVCGYVIIRQIAQRHLKKREIENRLNENMNDQNEPPVVVEEQIDATSSTTSFGWGKKTRQRVKEQEKILEAKLEELKAAQGDEDDEDIADLLID